MIPNENLPISKLKENISKRRNNSCIHFLTKKYDIDPNKKNIEINDNNDLNKICSICRNTFHSMFNRDRHINTIHYKLNLKKCKIFSKSFQDIQKHIKACPPKKLKKLKELSIIH